MRNFLHIIKKVTLWLLAITVAVVLLLPVALYIPAVQEFAKDAAVKIVRKQTGLDVSVDYIRLRFPLSLAVRGATVREASGDTMIHASDVGLDVAFLPLLKQRLEVKEAKLTDVLYRLGNPDSAMQLTARIKSFTTRATSARLSFSEINIGPVLLDGADIALIMKDTTTASSDTASSTAGMMITAPDIELRDVRFRMTMMPTIDSMDISVPAARLADGLIDMGAKKISVESLTVDSVTAVYLTPSAEYLAEHPADTVTAASQTTEAGPWTITARHLGLTARSGLYAMRGASPAAGFDPSYIEATDIDIRVDTFYNRGTEITVPLTHMAARERCGIALKGKALFSMDSTAMKVRDARLSTIFSALDIEATMGIGNLATDPNLPLDLDARGSVGLADIESVMPSLSAMLHSVPRTSDLIINARINGTSGSLNVDTVSVAMHRYLALTASGRIDNPMDFNRMNGRISIDGTLTDVNFIKPTLLEARMARQINIPPARIRGSVDYSPNLIAGNISVATGKGRVAVNGSWNGKTAGYKGHIDATDFPVASFMPSLGIGDVSLTAQAGGRGFDFTSPSATLEASLKLIHATYNGEQLRDIDLDARLASSVLTAKINSGNPAADMDATVVCDMTSGDYRWKLDGDVRHIDLRAFHLSDTTMYGSMLLASEGSFAPRTGFIDAGARLNSVSWQIGGRRISIPELNAGFSADSLTKASLTTGDFTANFHALCPLDTLMNSFTNVSGIITRQLADRYIAIDSIQRHLPGLEFNASMGSNNGIASFLAESKITFKSANFFAHNDSLLNITSRVIGLSSGNTRTDTISLDAKQRGRYMLYSLAMNNRKGTFDDFAHVNLNGFIGGDRLAAMINQSDINNRQGFHIGVTSTMKDDSTIVVKLVPRAPVIAYKKWRLNPDNFIAFNIPNKHLDANLELKCDSSIVAIRTDHAVATDTIGGHSMAHQDDVVLRLANINIADWLSISPFAPPVAGELGADMRFRWTNGNLADITGQGSINLDELYYGRERVGSFTLGMDISNSSRGLHANVDLLVDSVKVITANGVLNDSTLATPFLLDFSMIKFPLKTVNPFLPKDVAQLSGVLNGQMKITGEMAAPVFNGFIDFDNAAVKVGMTGASYAFSDEKVPVDSNIVRFDNYTIAGLNSNSLAINGTVDVRSLADVLVDLTAKASNLQIVNSSRPRGANLYGKAFIDLDASVKGSMSFLDVNASLNVLPGTNVTYVMTDVSDSRLVSRGKSSMVKFVQFSDTARVEEADSITRPEMAMNLEAMLRISQGSTINVDLSPDGKNKASIEGEGSLQFSMTPMNDGRLTGRFNINKGFVRYSPPFMSEKNFSFQEGSYIAFNGDMLNPTLNIKAVDKMKANVTQQGQNSRLVNFNVGLAVTNTLQNMNVSFDLSTDDDLTIENELSSMSAQQRANQAMNMLLYNIYSGPGTKANTNLSGNQLFSFLESQINSWAANNIKGVDISFGIDQYDKTTDGSTSTTTSYSYRVSKSLFNDRIKIIVGGNYSTDADSDENFSQNLINDISFEYMLNRSGSMFIRLFRHVGYESILEGEITQTGVGFVLRRKINSLRDVFRLRRPPKKLPPLTSSPDKKQTEAIITKANTEEK